ncbi:hypothetical protein Rhopal_007654-T1 [Rhodotorula paludigena]|uniref:Arrestin-like N-terminal domain-containing protein n=1 Tax=Rhodotorula paludigena TaxID=86838 RepID=A0AAV5GYI3_9BASI|nr:hypothetical protein Rhopal_007654-T1 [Rhodotorula paludigena]
MSKDQPRITLRPPPHRDYLQGYPGIPAADPSKDPAPTPDPLLRLPHLPRPQAHLTGTVEIRAPLKGPAIRARWLSVELEKIETVPAAPNDPSGGGTPTKSKNADGGAKKECRFVELIGVGPNKLWEAGVSQGADVSAVDSTPRKKGFKGVFGRGGSSSQDNDDEGDGFDFIPEGNYPFEIAIPEGLPPTIEVDSKLNGVAYQLVASLCTKGKKGLLKGSTKPAIFIASASVLLNKADILPTWPAYQPLLPLPLPPKLPWAGPPGEPTVGETRESKLAIRREEGTAGEVWMKTTRQSLAFGPGDNVRIFVQIGWGGEKPINLTRLDFVLRETLTYRYPSASNPNYIVRGPPRVNTLFTSNASVSPDPNNPTAFAVLYQNEPVAFDLAGVHVDVSYHLKVRAMLEGGDEVSVDSWPVVIGNCDQRTSKGVMHDIGWVEGLCDRGGASEPITSPVSPAPAASPFSSSTTPIPQRPTFPHSSSAPVSSPPLMSSPPPAVDDATAEKARLRTTGFHVANQGPADEGYHSRASPPQEAMRARHTSSRHTSYEPAQTAAEEKRRYLEATRSRDALQTSAHTPAQQSCSPSLMTTDLSRGVDVDVAQTPSAEDEQVAVHRAAFVNRYPDDVQRPMPVRAHTETAPIRASMHVENAPTFAKAHLAPTRSNTMLAMSGSDVSLASSPATAPPIPAVPRSPPGSPPNPTAALLGRTLTTAEAEKRRLFLDAKEEARRRQEEARLELERQNQALAELEFEEAQNAYEARLIAEAEDERREVERLAREAFETERRARIRQEEERWAREEEERQAQVRREMEEKKRRAELAMQEELRRFEQQHLEAERERAEEIERQAEERKREDEQKRARAEEIRRLDEERARQEEERRNAATRKAEMERHRAEAERRRLEGEQARAAEIARIQALEEARLHQEAERRRYEEEQEARMRAEEEDARRRFEAEQRRQHEEDERRRQEAAEDARARAEAEERRRYAEHEAILAQEQQHRTQVLQPTYPHPAESPSHLASNVPNGLSSARSYVQHEAQLQRAPSVASFAPSMSAANATADFYAQQIAQQSSLSDEKAAYLRQLRQRVGSPQGGQSTARSFASPSPNSAYHDPAALQPAYPQHPGFPQPLPQPLHPSYPSPPTRQSTCSSSAEMSPPSAQPVDQTYDMTPSPSAAPYKSAAQEKEEAAARHRAEEARGKQAVIPEEDEAPPSYPAPPAAPGAASGSSRSAADEKAELARYYSAKAAVDAQQSQQPANELAAPTFDRSPLTSPVPTYQARGDDGPAYPSQLGGPASLRASVMTTATTTSDSSASLHRDPSIAAGKRVQRAPSASESLESPSQLAYMSLPPSAPSQAFNNPYSPVAPLAPGVPMPQAEPAREPGDYGSFRPDEFPEFDELSAQIAAANASRLNGGYRSPL